MMRFLLPVLLLVIGLGGGVGAGFMLSGGSEEDPGAAHSGTDPETDGDGAGGDEHAGDADHADDDGHGSEPQAVEQTGSGTEYVRLNNQFVVPVVRNGTVRSLVVLGLTIEVGTGQNSAVFSREPRLRDSFLRVLFAHANSGGFDGSFTESAAMAPLREGLREAAVGILGAATVHDVLITDITRQDA